MALKGLAGKVAVVTGAAGGIGQRPAGRPLRLMIFSKSTSTASWSVTGYSVVPFVANAVMIVQSWVLCAG